MRYSNRTLLAVVITAGLAQAVVARVIQDDVAKVNGQVISLSEYQRELRAALELWERKQPGAVADPGRLQEVREGVLEQLIDQELLRQQGTELKIKVRERDIEQGIEEVKSRFTRDETGKVLSESEADKFFREQLKGMGVTFSGFRERISRQVMIRKVIDEAVRAKVRRPEEGDVEAYFEKVKKYIVSGSTFPPNGMDEENGIVFMEVARDVKLMSSERVRVSRILVRFSPGASPKEKQRALNAAKSVKERLDKGASFGDLAREESEDPDSAARGGDIGFVFRGLTPPAFEKAAFSIPLGKISDPIETDIGYHVIRVVEKRAADTPEFSSFRDDLTRFLMNMRFNDELAAYVKRLKAKAVIERDLPER